MLALSYQPHFSQIILLVYQFSSPSFLFIKLSFSFAIISHFPLSDIKFKQKQTSKTILYFKTFSLRVVSFHFILAGYQTFPKQMLYVFKLGLSFFSYQLNRPPYFSNLFLVSIVKSQCVCNTNYSFLYKINIKAIMF